MSVEILESGLAHRGCTLDADSDPNWCNKMNERDECETCNGNACNVKNVRHQFCVECDSESENNCAKLDDSHDYVTACGGDPYSYEDRGCFTLKKSK